jgi:hypothetical protein
LFDIRDVEKEICVIDSTTFFDKFLRKQFITLSMKSKSTNSWQDFWSHKEKSNKELIKAAKEGNTKLITKLLNKMREAEKTADINYCD